MSKNYLKLEKHFLKTLIAYYDKFVLTQEDCSYLCDSFSSLMENCEFINHTSINGFHRRADHLKSRMQSLKENLRDILDLVIQSQKTKKKI